MNVKDQWETPLDLFSELDREYNFLIDACTSNGNNSKCPFFLKDATLFWNQDNLSSVDSDSPYVEHLDFSDYSVFMNPPYSNPKPFLERAWEFSTEMTVVCLVPISIITCKYMDFLFKEGRYRVPKPGLGIRYLSRRTRFTHPTKKVSSPPGGCMLLIMNRSSNE